MDFGSILSKSYLGIPGWLIAVAGGVGVWYFFLRGNSAGSSSSSGVSPDSAYGLGYAQGLQAAQANGTIGTNTSQAGAQASPPRPQKQKGTPGGQFPGGPVGGFSSQGSRSSSWVGNYFDRRITRRVVYSHYVRAVGGPATHRTEVASVAARSGIHVGRLQALNPVYTGTIRIA